VDRTGFPPRHKAYSTVFFPVPLPFLAFPVFLRVSVTNVGLRGAFFLFSFSPRSLFPPLLLFNSTVLTHDVSGKLEAAPVRWKMSPPPLFPRSAFPGHRRLHFPNGSFSAVRLFRTQSPFHFPPSFCLTGFVPPLGFFLLTREILCAFIVRHRGLVLLTFLSSVFPTKDVLSAFGAFTIRGRTTPQVTTGLYPPSSSFSFRTGILASKGSA